MQVFVWHAVPDGMQQESKAAFSFVGSLNPGQNGLANRYYFKVMAYWKCHINSSFGNLFCCWMGV